MSPNNLIGGSAPSDQLSSDHLLGIQDLSAADIELIDYEAFCSMAT